MATQCTGSPQASWAGFQTPAEERILQWRESNEWFGFPVRIKAMFTLRGSLLSVCNSIMSKNTTYMPSLKKYFIARKCSHHQSLLRVTVTGHTSL